jgi:hypothetical protein
MHRSWICLALCGTSSRLWRRLEQSLHLEMLTRAIRRAVGTTAGYRTFTSLPIIDLSVSWRNQLLPLLQQLQPERTCSMQAQHKTATAAAIHAACRDVGFFYVSGHGGHGSGCYAAGSVHESGAPVAVTVEAGRTACTTAGPPQCIITYQELPQTQVNGVLPVVRPAVPTDTSRRNRLAVEDWRMQSTSGAVVNSCTLATVS